MLENVSPFPSADERLVAKARRAQQHYAAALADAGKGQQLVIEAIVEMGETLIEGKGGKSNKAFSEWVHANKLDVEPPWDQRPERTCAVTIAHLVRGNTPTDAFDGCPHTRPTDVMKWYRQRNMSPEKRAEREAKAKAKAEANAAYAIKTLEERGEIIPAKEAAEAAQLAAENQALVQADFSPKSKLTIQKAIEIYKARVMKSFHTAVQAEAIKLRKSADEATREHNLKLVKENIWLQQRLNEKALFTQAEWRMIQMALHPDNAASPEVRARAFDLMKQKERRLVKAD